MNSLLPIAPLALTLWLVACTVGVEPPEHPYASSRGPIVLAVEEVIFEDRSTPPSEGNFIDRRRSRELAERAQSFLKSRLQAGGGSGVARVVVEKAVLLERPKPEQAGYLDPVVREADRVLDGSVAVRIAIEDWSGIERAFARAEVARLRPILENTSVASRHAEAKRLVEDLVAQLDEALQKSAEDNLSAFLAF